MRIQHIAPLTTLVFLGLIGCSDNSTPSTQTEQKATTPATTSTTNSTSTLPADAPTYKVASTGTGAPMTTKDESGNLTGIDIDIIKNIGEREGFKVELVPTNWSDLFVGLEKGSYDIVISGASWTEERESKYGVSNGYFFSPASFAYSDNSDKKPKTLADLKGLRIGALAGSKHEKTAKDIGASEVVVSERGFDIITQMAQGKVDAFIHDYIDLKEYQGNYPDQKLIIEHIEDENQKGAYLVVLTQKDNTELLTKINSGIDKLKADGTIDKISEKYLGKAD